MTTFHTVLLNLKSPQNVGMIIRSHVAFGGGEIVIVGDPWTFKKGVQDLSRGLERICAFTQLDGTAALMDWSKKRRLPLIALEISPVGTTMRECEFPSQLALLLGNEATGIAPSLLARCDAVVTIPQFGPVGSLNVAVAASIAMYEMKSREVPRPIVGGKFDVPPALRSLRREE